MTRPTRAMLLGALLLLSALSAAQGTYRLQQDDLIRIQVYNELDIVALVPVGPDGYVSAPFVGALEAEGFTTAELEEKLAKAYAERLGLKDPIVSVIGSYGLPVIVVLV